MSDSRKEILSLLRLLADEEEHLIQFKGYLKEYSRTRASEAYASAGA